MRKVTVAKKTTSKSATSFDKKTYLKWYESMLMMRRFEEKCGQLYLQQHFGGFCHLYIGQEAVMAGVASAIKKGDKLITAYRDHGHPIALGMDPKYVMAELYGKITGPSKGKGGSMHMFDVKRGLMGGHGIVGAQIPMGAGIAFAEKYKGTKHATLAFMGDGAVRQGGLHEAFNMAMIWELPIIFIIENNNYAMGTSVQRTTNVTELEKIGLSYNMPSESVDGMSCEAIHNAIDTACKHVRAGKGPMLLNIKTYRYKGHSMSDPQKYRSKEELEKYKAIDPLEMVKATILKNKFATEKVLKDLDTKTKAEILEAVKFAEASPLPKPEDLYQDVYSSEYPYIKE